MDTWWMNVTAWGLITNQLQFGRQKTRLNSVDFAVAAAEREDIDEATARHVVVAGVRCSATLISGARALVNVVCKQKHNYVHDCNSVLQMDISFYYNGVGGVYTEKAHDACSSFRI